MWIMKFPFTSTAVLQQISMWTESPRSEGSVLHSCILVSVQEGVDSHEHLYYTPNALHENITEGWVKQCNGTVSL